MTAVLSSHPALCANALRSERPEAKSVPSGGMGCAASTTFRSHHLERAPLVRKRPGFPIHFTDGEVLNLREKRSERSRKGWEKRRVVHG